MLSTTEPTQPSSSRASCGPSDDGVKRDTCVTTVPDQPDQRLARHQRLTRSSQFQDAYRQGRRCIGRYMVLWLLKDEKAALRLGVVASRKVGGAIARNAAKRRLRECFRRNRHRLSGSFDVVLVARRGIQDASWDAVVEDMMFLADKAGLVRK